MQLEVAVRIAVAEALAAATAAAEVAENGDVDEEAPRAAVVLELLADAEARAARPQDRPGVHRRLSGDPIAQPWRTEPKFRHPCGRAGCRTAGCT